MKCSNCGKEIPFTGKVCPFCNVDKSADKKLQVLVTVFGTGGAIAGYNLLGFWGAVGGFVVGSIAAGGVAFKISKK